MYWENGHGWGWAGMAAGMTFFWVLLIVTIVVTVAWTVRGTGPAPSAGREAARAATVRDARSVLDHRLARGEIDVAEYESRLAALEQAGG